MNFANKIKNYLTGYNQLKMQNQELRYLIGSVLSKNIQQSSSLNDAEFKIFSQFGDDGIIQYLIKKLSINNKIFVEFGVEDYQEANTRFLMMHDNWRGLVIDGSEANISDLKKDPIFWKYNITAVASFITAENINDLFIQNNFKGPIGILSIDIDGNDYWVWNAINIVDPDMVIIEYNSVFGAERAITVPYTPDFVRSKAHYSYLYAGASLSALYELGSRKGYFLIGCNQAGNNAYFAKKELCKNIQTLIPAEGFIQSQFQEARSPNGELSFISYTERQEILRGLPVYNVHTQQIELY